MQSVACRRNEPVAATEPETTGGELAVGTDESIDLGADPRDAGSVRGSKHGPPR